MSLDHWDSDAKGDPLIGQVVGWETALTPLVGLLRLRFAHDKAQFEKGGAAAQVHMTPDQLRQLSKDLREMADAIDALPKGSKQ